MFATVIIKYIPKVLELQVSPFRALITIATATLSIFSSIVCVGSARAVSLVDGDTFYTDSTSFNTSTNGLKSIDFTQLVDSTGAPSTILRLITNTTNGVTFAGSNLGVAYIGGGNRFPPRSIADNLTATSNLNGGISISALLPSGVTAVGASLTDLTNINTPGNNFTSFPTTFTITLSDGSSETESGSSIFAGFTSKSDIGAISFFIPGQVIPPGSPGPFRNEYLVLQRLQIGYANTATSVPEPFTIIGTLIGGTVAFQIRKKLKSASKV